MKIKIQYNKKISQQGLGQARPNKITWKTRKSLRSEGPDGQEIFKN